VHRSSMQHIQRCAALHHIAQSQRVLSQEALLWHALALGRTVGLRRVGVASLHGVRSCSRRPWCSTAPSWICASQVPRRARAAGRAAARHGAGCGCVSLQETNSACVAWRVSVRARAPAGAATRSGGVLCSAPCSLRELQGWAGWALPCANGCVRVGWVTVVRSGGGRQTQQSAGAGRAAQPRHRARVGRARARGLGLDRPLQGLLSAV
jgi:hypothetical protein